jgi:hypothetical protein
MDCRLSKPALIRMFCYFRQAERSVHYALSCQELWPSFTAYYSPKQMFLRELIEMLRKSGGTPEFEGRPRALSQNELVNALRCAAYFLSSRLRKSWFFSSQEISFFAATFNRLLNAVRAATSPSKEELLFIRHSCLECQYLISRKLVGLPELRKAGSIEHWLHPEHLELVRLEDLGFQDESGGSGALGRMEG